MAPLPNDKGFPDSTNLLFPQSLHLGQKDKGLVTFPSLDMAAQALPPDPAAQITCQIPRVDLGAVITNEGAPAIYGLTDAQQVEGSLPAQVEAPAFSGGELSHGPWGSQGVSG
jgi:hypothetical protein